MVTLEATAKPSRVTVSRATVSKPMDSNLRVALLQAVATLNQAARTHKPPPAATLNPEAHSLANSRAATSKTPVPAMVPLDTKLLPKTMNLA